MCVQPCPTLYNPMDCSPPGSSVHEIFQARILKWVAIFSSRGSFRPRDGNWVSVTPALQVDSLQLFHLGSPLKREVWIKTTLSIICKLYLNNADLKKNYPKIGKDKKPWWQWVSKGVGASGANSEEGSLARFIKISNVHALGSSNCSSHSQL